MRVVYKIISVYNPRTETIVFDDMIADINSNKKLHPVVKELFFRGRKINSVLVFITKSYFRLPKDVRLNSTH